MVATCFRNASRRTLKSAVWRSTTGRAASAPRPDGAISSGKLSAAAPLSSASSRARSAVSSTCRPSSTSISPAAEIASRESRSIPTSCNR